MNAWEIWSYQPPGWPTAHPAVIVSHPARVAHKPEVTVVMCASQRAARPPEPHEVLLDEADGLAWPTLCKCDLLYAVKKSALTYFRGAVTAERKRQIIATINRANGWV
jgi:mRNA-degrading endonuclease toxin of MazEF toxin-antitoxin module